MSIYFYMSRNVDIDFLLDIVQTCAYVHVLLTGFLE